MRWLRNAPVGREAPGSEVATLMPLPVAASPAAERPEVTPIGEVRFRERVRVRGMVLSVRVVPWVESSPVLECTVFDGTGGLTLVFLGRHTIGGIRPGTVLETEGRVVEARGRLVLMNPPYDLISVDR